METKAAAHKVVDLPDKDLAYSNRVFVHAGCLACNEYVKVALPSGQYRIFRVMGDERVESGTIAMSRLQRDSYWSQCYLGSLVNVTPAGVLPPVLSKVLVEFFPMEEVPIEVDVQELSALLADKFAGEVVSRRSKLAIRNYKGHVLVFAVQSMKFSNDTEEMEYGRIGYDTTFLCVTNDDVAQYVKMLNNKPLPKREEVKTEAPPTKQQPSEAAKKLQVVSVDLDSEWGKMAERMARMDIVDELAKLVTTHRDIVAGLAKGGRTPADANEPYKSALEAMEIRKQGL